MIITSNQVPTGKWNVAGWNVTCISNGVLGNRRLTRLTAGDSDIMLFISLVVSIATDAPCDCILNYLEQHNINIYKPEVTEKATDLMPVI